MHGPRSTGRNWACANLGTYDVDGLWVQSTATKTGSTPGSSPRGRDGQAGHGRQGPDVGLIPARAGRSAARRSARIAARAHPRAGGAVGRCDRALVAGRGSSPRGRGGLGAFALTSSVVGLIPARAGRSASHRHAGTQTGAHPRAGGAVNDRVVRRRPEGGSSPRGRGGQPPDMPTAMDKGLIPARAGRSSSAVSGRGSRRAHPRAGGAVRSRQREPREPEGSSPRGRGGRDP